MNSTSGFSNVMHQDRNPTMQPDATKWFSQWQKEKKRKDYTFRRQFNEKPSIVPGCPGAQVEVCHLHRKHCSNSACCLRC